ncbi:MAG: hypothetical protein JXQ75_23580 [Phycisphaerae bacterium]|nr:hypothetical protein [Phycisphaerae bacterium]
MICVVLVFAAILALPGSGDDDRLIGPLREHFLAKTRSEQRRLQKQILAIDGLTPEKLAGAIRGLQLWEKQPAGEQEMSIRLRKGESSEIRICLSVPRDYDPIKRWPLVIAFHGSGGSAQTMFRMTRQMLGHRAEEFIVAAPQDIGRLGFTLPADVVGRPRYLVRALRRQFHIDNDRVYLMGYSLGSHNAWMAAVMHADCFAGIVPLASPLQLVGRDMLYGEVLPNARSTAVLFCWGAKDNVDAEGKPQPDGGNAALNRTMSAVIGALAYEHFEAVELVDVGHLGVVPPADRLDNLLNQRRTHYPKYVRQAYRLPDQSEAYWVSSDRLIGEPLPHGNLQIPYEEGENPLVAQRKWLIDKLGLVEAKCQGQTIKLTTRRSGHVILLLSDELLDLDQPVKIIRNKKTRLDGRVKRDMRVMLTEAAQGWDFDRLPVARVVIPVSGNVKFGYPNLSPDEDKKTKKKKDERIKKR